MKYLSFFKIYEILTKLIEIEFTNNKFNYDYFKMRAYKIITYLGMSKIEMFI